VKILVADDDAISRRILQNKLNEWGHDVVACPDGVSAWEALKQQDPPKLLILDWMMPGMDGIDLCRELRKQNDHPYSYIILLTGKGAKEDIVEGLESGADDYVVKPFDPNELKVRLRAGARILQLQEDLIAALKMSQFQATHDSLTGLWNRRAILEALEKELARARRENRPLGIIVADVDHFKQVNDRYGHVAGDAVLREIAARIRGSLRTYDSAGRYGGEEFVVALPGCDEINAVQSAERLRVAIAAQPIQVEGASISCTMSFGVTCVPGPSDADLDTAIRSADEALYLAKDRGRNRVELRPLRHAD